jgi:hypothetical protein
MSIKKTLVLLFFIVFAATALKAQTDWVKQPLDKRVAIKFPAAPKIITQGGNKVYRETDKDSIIYSASTIDFAVVANLDSAKLAPMKDTQQFADGLKAGMSRTAPGYVFSDVAVGKWNGYSSYRVTGVNATKKSKVYVFIILIGSKGYYLSCAVPDGVSPQNKDDYFAAAELLH